MVRESSGVNQFTVAVVGFVVQSSMNTNPMLSQLGINAIGVENQDINLVLVLNEPQ